MCYDLNKRRKYSDKFKPSSKTTRKVIRANRKKKIDKHNKSEGKTYKAGGF